MKRIFIGLLLFIVLAAGATYIYYSRILAPEDIPSEVTRAEDALSTQGTIAIASMDVRYVRRIEEVLADSADPAPMGETEPADNILAQLKVQGVDLYAQTDYALSVISLDQDKPAYSFVLLGRFSLDKLRLAIEKYYSVEDVEDNTWLIEKRPEMQPVKDPCARPVPGRKKQQEIQAIHVQKDRILLTSPQLMPGLLQRFADNAPAEVALEKWRKFRKDKVVAGVFMAPAEAKKGARDLPSAILLGAVAKQPLQALYAGAVVDLLPAPGVTMLVDAHASESDWPAKFKAKYDAWLSETVSSLEQMPTLAALISSLSVNADKDILHVRTTADRQTLANLEKLPAEFFQMIFSTAKISSSDDKTAPEEAILKEENIDRFVAEYNLGAVPDYDASKEFYKPDLVSGPFAISLDKISLLDLDDSIIELSVRVKGAGFENLSRESMHVTNQSQASSLYITSVADSEGNNLLREELCGSSRNQDAAQLQSNRDKDYVDGKWVNKSLEVLGKKDVRLKPGVALSQVDKISGKVIIRAATAVRIETVTAPFAGKSVTTDKVRMFLKKSSPGQLSYQLSGDMSRILAVRAKNAKGEYLQTAGSSSFGPEGNRHIGKSFKGEISAIEVVVAENILSKEYPFILDHVAPRFGKQGDEQPVAPKPISKNAFLNKYSGAAYADECKNGQKKMLGAFMLCLNKFGNRWGNEVGGDFEVTAPAAGILQKNLSAATLHLDTLITESGEEIAFNKNEKISFDHRYDSRYNNDKKIYEKVNERLHASYVRVYSDDKKLKDLRIRTITGSLQVRLPEQLKYFELDADQLGAEASIDNGLEAKIAAFEDCCTYIQIRGPVEKVVRLIPVTKEGTMLVTGNERINRKQYQTWGLSKEEKAKIDSLPETWTGMITIYGEPDVIRVYYADDYELIKQDFKFNIEQTEKP